MSAKKRVTELRHLTGIQEQQEAPGAPDAPDALDTPALLEVCTCVPLASCQLTADRDDKDEQAIVPTPPQVQYLLRTRLKESFPEVELFSLLLLHVSQVKHTPLQAHDSGCEQESKQGYEQSQRYHVTPGVLAQIMNNVRRAIRTRDEMCIADGVGAVLFFPGVDEQGIQNIMERVYNSISLLQAETIVPPLMHTTDIVLGCGTYIAPPGDTAHPSSRSRAALNEHSQGQREDEQVIEHVLLQTSKVARRLVLRPALATSLWETMPQVASVEPVFNDVHGVHKESLHRIEQQEMTHADNVRDVMRDNLHSLPRASYISPVVSQVLSPAIEYHGTMHTPTHPASPTTIRHSQKAQKAQKAQESAAIPFLQLPTTLPARLKHLIPYPVALHLRCAPVGRDHHTLTVAMADPADSYALQRLREITGMMIFPVSCELEALMTLLAETW